MTVLFFEKRFLSAKVGGKQKKSRSGVDLLIFYLLYFKLEWISLIKQGYKYLCCCYSAKNRLRTLGGLFFVNGHICIQVKKL